MLFCRGKANMMPENWGIVQLISNFPSEKSISTPQRHMWRFATSTIQSFKKDSFIGSFSYLAESQRKACVLHNLTVIKIFSYRKITIIFENTFLVFFRYLLLEVIKQGKGNSSCDHTPKLHWRVVEIRYLLLH